MVPVGTISGESTTAIEFGGTSFNLSITEQYDRIRMNGNVTSKLTLGGVLNINLINSFTLAANQRFGIIQLEGLATRSNTFTGLATNGSLVGNFNGQSLFITYSANFGNAGAISLPGGNDIALYTIPEPSSALLLLGGVGIILGIRRR